MQTTIELMTKSKKKTKKNLLDLNKIYKTCKIYQPNYNKMQILILILSWTKMRKELKKPYMNKMKKNLKIQNQTKSNNNKNKIKNKIKIKKKMKKNNNNKLNDLINFFYYIIIIVTNHYYYIINVSIRKWLKFIINYY